ncbi:EAL domain-containing protein [Marinomonas dokdonensis]|uniref:EAL domain-containing protein n=1 Tax=Marinomonas dokdonensis TaxID=328224 RepID=UPI004055479D
MKLIVFFISFLIANLSWASHETLPFGQLLHDLPTFQEDSPITPEQAFGANYTASLYSVSQSFSDKAFWHKLTFASSSNADEIQLNFNYYLTEKLDFYLFDGSNLRQHWAYGYAQKPSATDKLSDGIWIPIELSKEHSTTLLIRKQGTHPLITPITLFSPEKAANEKSIKIIFWAIVLSTLLALLTHNLFVFFLLRYSGFFYYLALNAALLISLSVLLGFNQWLFSQVINQWLTHQAFTLFGVCAWMLYRFSLLFFQDLSLPTKDSIVRKYGDWVFICYLVGSFFLPAAVTAALMGSLELMLFICCNYWGIRAYKNGFVAVRFYLFSWLVLMIGSMLSTLIYWRILPVNMLTEMILPISCILQLLGFSFAFADKAKIIEKNRQLNNVTDSLTGLPNRSFCLGNLTNLLKNHPSAVLVMIEVTSHAQLSQAFGPARGDATFSKLVNKLNDTLSDMNFILDLEMPDHQIKHLIRVTSNRVAFVSLSLNDLNEQIAKVQKALSAPISIDKVPFIHQYKIGSTIYPIHGKTIDKLYQNTLVACNSAQLPTNWVAYDTSLETNQAHQLRLITLLTQDIEQNKLYFEVQPQVNFSHGEIIGGEILLRWKNDDLGIISPGEFIPLAEKSGLIHKLTDFIIDNAFKWASEHEGKLMGQTLSINISAQDLLQPDFANRVIEQQRKYNILAKQFFIEVTETSIFQKSHVVVENVKRLRDVGFKLAIDDFGVGYSSMQNLVTLNASELKIDKFFIDKIVDDPQSATLCQSMINLSRELGIISVAEGIETKEIADLLRSWNCQAAQGYYFYRPMSSQAYLDEITKS